MFAVEVVHEDFIFTLRSKSLNGTFAIHHNTWLQNLSSRLLNYGLAESYPVGT